MSIGNTGPGITRPEAPYGVSFAIDELVSARDWAAQRRLGMTLLLDSVVDGAEFEEMIVITTADRRRRLLMVWRRPSEVIAQLIGRMPRAFADVTSALDAMLPATQRRFWL